MTARVYLEKVRPQLDLSLDRLRAGARLIPDFLLNAVLQARTYRKLYAGVMHALIFWGVTIQVLGTAINLMQMQLFIPFVELPFPRGGFYLAFELVMDLAGIAILLGVGMALVRRFILRPEYLETRWDDVFALILLGLIPLAGFTVEGLRLVAAAPDWTAWSPAGSLVAGLLAGLGMTPGQAAGLHDLFFWIHAALGLSLLVSIPFTKLRHLMNTPLHILLRSRRKTGELDLIEDIEETELLGVGAVVEFLPRQLLSFDACLNCGRCEENCPAAQSGMPFSPRSLIQALRDELHSTLMTPAGSNGHNLVGDTVAEDALWCCTTCSACLSGCPAFVNPMDEVIDLRRYQALTTGKLPKTVADTFRNMERQGNPWGMPAGNRLDWAEGLDVRELAPGDETDVLFFVGCAASYDTRSRQVTRTFVKLLNQAGIDFGVMGLDEMCCGETARRLGHEYLFQEFAKQNIEVFSSLKFKRIVTQCPHCFNTLKNEYPQLGGTFPVQHHTELLAELAFPVQGISTNGTHTVTYHDSCYLGRYHQIYDPPRRLLEKAGLDPVEMSKHGANSFCCGGGGGQMWLETDPGLRINQRRLAQALETKADVVATACPYCLLMFDDAIRSKGLGDQMKVMDVAEILTGRLQG